MGLSRALDKGQFALMASNDLSSAFDLVNVNLMLKRCRIIGLPNDVVDLIEGLIKLDWLNLSYDAFKIKCKNLILAEQIK